MYNTHILKFPTCDSLRSDGSQLSGKSLCGLVENLLLGVDFLIENDLQEELPLHVSLVTRARTYTTDRNAVVDSNSDPNESNTNVHLHPMTNANDGAMDDIVVNDGLPNDCSPASTLIDDSDEDITDETVMLQEQSELHSNASDLADTALQAEYDDFGNLFDEVETPMLSDEDMVSRAKLIELQRSDRSLDKLFSLAQIGHTNNAVSYFAIKNDVLVRHSMGRVVPVGLEITQIVVPKQLHLKLLTVAHDYPTSGHLEVKKTLERLTRHFYWVGVGKAVRAFCRSCDVCQRLGRGFISEGTLNQSSSAWQYLLQYSG